MPVFYMHMYTHRSSPPLHPAKWLLLHHEKNYSFISLSVAILKRNVRVRLLYCNYKQLMKALYKGNRLYTVAKKN